MQITDPNIQKFIDANLLDIKNGDITTVVSHVKDYLFRITSPFQASKELAAFMSHLRRLENQ